MTCMCDVRRNSVSRHLDAVALCFDIVVCSLFSGGVVKFTGLCV